MNNSNMKVLLISPQHWGTMRVTKHHYAIELAKLGHEVFFLEPTEATWAWNTSSFDISDSDAEGVKIMRQKINIPYNVKFHLRGLYDWFIKRHIKKLEKLLGPFDLVWSFDLSNTMPLNFFQLESKKIFFAADWPKGKDSFDSAKDSDLLISISDEILKLYPSQFKTKSLLLTHGVSDCFIEESKKSFIKIDDKIRIGMSGNFLRPDIDRIILLDIFKIHSDILFECFGSFELNNSNLGGTEDKETTSFIKALQLAPNVILHGMVQPDVLAKELRRMDAFLICYDVEKDQSKGTNYHKVMEFLTYQKPIISNFISSYSMDMSCFIMPRSRFEKLNPNFINVFKKEINSRSCQCTYVKSYSELLNVILERVPDKDRK